MNGLNDLDVHFRNVIRSQSEYRFGKNGINQNETSLDRNVMIKDTTLSNRFKNILIKFGVITVGNLEDLRGLDLLNVKGMGEKLHKEHSQFVYVNKLGVHRD